ncbi:MAG: UvrD-helicase domain-containing protein [Methanobrevibacter smithii]
MTVVGDDWQSIYRFRGTNIEFFSHFEELFENPQRIFIEKTYRNPQELIDIAGSFIMKNPKQIRKSLKSPKNLKKPVKIIYPQKNPIEKREMIYNLIKIL